MKRPKPNYRILKTLDEDYCIIEEDSKIRKGRKIAAFDDLDKGNPTWDSEVIYAEMQKYEKAKRLEENAGLKALTKGKKN